MCQDLVNNHLITDKYLMTNVKLMSALLLIDMSKDHPWFNDFDWASLQDCRMAAPYIPNSETENFDQNHVNNQEWKDAEAVKENEIHLKNPTTQQLFKGYFFDKNHQPHPSNTKSTTGGNTAGNEIETEGHAGNKNINY